MLFSGGQPACAMYARRQAPAATDANLQNNHKTAYYCCSDGRWPSKIYISSRLAGSPKKIKNKIHSLVLLV